MFTGMPSAVLQFVLEQKVRHCLLGLWNTVSSFEKAGLGGRGTLIFVVMFCVCDHPGPTRRHIYPQLARRKRNNYRWEIA